MHHRLEYRPHIDGLRAIAVCGVVLFHFGLTSLSGGFSGVDVFFVISGFLISKALYRDIAAGTFSYADFYARRARRILPAYVVVSLLSLVAAVVLLHPDALRDFARSLLASALFIPNIYFYFAADYFGPDAIQLPLLHYWSLGVEEQFYLLFPPLLMLAWRHGRRQVPALLAGLGVLSLLGCEMMLRADQDAAFYLLPFRAFELLIGAALALPGVRYTTDRRMADGAVTLGLALIIGGMLALSEDGPFPGSDALIPCLGTALVIWGADRVPQCAGARLLALPPLLFLGRISYSLYLVHWPVAVFGRQLFPFLEDMDFFIWGVGASLVLATLSYWLVEMPFRRPRPAFSARKILLAGAGAVALLAVLAGVILVGRGFPGRVETRVLHMLTYLSYRTDDVFREGTCFMSPRQPASYYRPDLCIPAQRPLAILWGDSHAAHLRAGLQPLFAARGYGLGQITASGCPPLPGVAIPIRPHCQAFNEQAIAEILRLKPDLLVIAALWMPDPAWLEALGGVLSRLEAAGIPVVVLGPGPVFKRPVPLTLADRLRAGDADTASRDEMMTAAVESEDASLAGLVAGYRGARYVSVLDRVCPAGQCALAEDGTPLFFDNAHLTKRGSAMFARNLIGDILPPK
ncbi:acyltransferase family protein [Xanthobacteraceae bacterium A53D]